VSEGSIDETAIGAVAVVTGGSGGAGREVVSALAERSFAVVLVYLRDQAKAEAAVEDVLAHGGTALAVRADVTDELDVERVFDETAAAFGGADVVVHAAPAGEALVRRHAERRVRPGGTTVNVADGHGVAAALDLVDRWDGRG
jgi:3-oxoacyl-[acyl-carrier protein] reductase